MEKKLKFICEHISRITMTPIRLYDNGRLIHTYSAQDFVTDPLSIYEKEVLTFKRNVSCYITPYFQYYGIINHEEKTVVAGPFGQFLIPNRQLREYGLLLGLTSENEFEQFTSFLQSIPSMSLENFLHLLTFINFSINDEQVSLSDLTIYDNLKSIQKNLFVTKQSNLELQAFDENMPFTHNTTAFEDTLLTYVSKGDVNTLESYISNLPAYKIGKLANDYIRQVKNVFIISTTIVSRTAIKSGVNSKDALDTSGAYIKHCEDLNDAKNIYNLQFKMIIDFAKMVQKIKRGGEPSSFVIEIINFVNQNIYNPLNIDTVAHHINMSSGALRAKFKKETGQTLSDYIIEEKIDEAKRLLSCTKNSLADIAQYLCFSSQSHFQNVFKKSIGVTPNVYRKLNKN